jgi:3-hydroxymyristoyl/3-hydroxydecanoyl-(acyl carrier protein) dehydratase
MPIEKTFTIDSRHPSLPGHFPGNPIVPGVVILEEILAQMGQSLNKPFVLTHVPSVKFHSPLRPDELLQLTFDLLEGHSVSFSCQVDSRLIVSGQFILQPDFHISPSPL